MHWLLEGRWIPVLSWKDSEIKPAFFDNIVATSKTRRRAPHLGPMLNPMVTCLLQTEHIRASRHHQDNDYAPFQPHSLLYFRIRHTLTASPRTQECVTITTTLVGYLFLPGGCLHSDGIAHSSVSRLHHPFPLLMGRLSYIASQHFLSFGPAVSPPQIAKSCCVLSFLCVCNCLCNDNNDQDHDHPKRRKRSRL